jgi:pimeloyl-ACP methyl ester carboxylesterase
VFAPDREVQIYRNETLRLAGREFEPAGDWKATVLLLHGHTPKGSNLAFYRVLARRLADRGYFVLTIDFAGFGLSDSPFSIPYEEGSSGDYDVRAWLDHLTSDSRLSSHPLFVVAHSAGASSGLPIGLGEDLVRGIAAIGPSRDVIEDLSDPEQADYWWSRNQATHRLLYGKEFPDWYSKERWLSEALGEGSGVGLKRPMEVFLPQLQDPEHHPVLLIDGERELEEDKLYLQAYYEAMAEPKDYHTLSGSDHYSNVAHVGRWAFYDREVVDETVTVLDDWMTRILQESPGS